MAKPMFGNRSPYFDRDGCRITSEEWSELFARGQEYRQIEFTETKNGDVSTVWLGLDHGRGGPPLIFETLIFGGSLDHQGGRYSTEEAARAGHAAYVLMCGYALEEMKEVLKLELDEEPEEGEP